MRHVSEVHCEGFITEKKRPPRQIRLKRVYGSSKDINMKESREGRKENREGRKESREGADSIRD